MARHITMQINGKKVVAELLDKKAPYVAAAFADSLPCKSFSTHAKFAGEELTVMILFYSNPENAILNVKPGDIGFYPDGPSQHLDRRDDPVVRSRRQAEAQPRG